MSALGLVITEEGLAECISAKQAGIQIKITHVGAGDRSYTPIANQTRLYSEKQRVEFNDTVDIGAGKIKAIAKFEGDLEYSANELGFYLETGTLLGVISSPGVTLNYKSAGGKMIIQHVLNLSALPTDSVSIQVGTDNLNILIDNEMMMDAVAFVRSQVVATKQAHMLMQLSEKLRLGG
ncbi:phage tail protein [Marinomonas mediterranea]|jgi:Phage-related tail fibre protein|uniref:Phage tail protein n=1 Tax=Marinomonas mediterranea (strain ATCC 700492 / JCM 21426 / NBRC 103028 / MMB-1) TaxID=717774 RepID=F2K227_MARM1|nr:hypothetical protein [Marinomonas mediterranea]ADZ91105.1 hypothetical protein Marme_1849 [Marinomonas mediterranea MMB-1]WCN13166.1 phage tail protein [Marinomonas mediterranea]WCN17237.1 phage tail protein [Marinomonas mediterranea MMB-1]